jgi:hypothetical protein
VVDVDYQAKTVTYKRVDDDEDDGGGKLETVGYDALINSSPIDQFVESTRICPPLNLAHNKVFLSIFSFNNDLLSIF